MARTGEKVTYTGSRIPSAPTEHKNPVKEFLYELVSSDETTVYRVRGGVDKPFLILVVLLVCFGSVMVSSSGYVYAKANMGDSFYFIKKQLVWAVIGILAMIGMSVVDYGFLKKMTLPIFGVSYLLLWCVFVPGIGSSAKGAKRWVEIGPIQFQPSEIMKFALVLLLALYISKFATRMKSFKYGIFIPACIIGFVCVTVALEKHMSGTIILFILGACMIFMSGASIKWIGGIAGAFGTAALGIILFTDYTKATGHTYLDIVVEATEDSVGYTRHLCVVCNYSYLSDLVTSGDTGYIEEEEQEPQHKHLYQLHVQDNAADKYFIALRVCACGDSKVGNLTADLTDENGQTIGYLTRDGTVSNFSGGRLGKADKGFLVDKNYVLIGRGNRDYFIRDEENQVIGELMLNGEVINTEGTVVGNITGSGEIRDAEENILATARELQYYNVHKPEPVKPADWATPPTSQIKVDAVPTPQPEEVGEYGMKTIGIALTPDGNYLGDILANNDVIDKLGNLLGKKMPDGLIIDDDGNLIGIEEVKNVTGGQMFVPAGTFGSGGAYGTGTAPTNLGPGGGFGPGERYDPVRAQALAAAQAARRSEMTVGQLSTTVKREDFDGRQNYWEGVERRISTWPVDMSEMILADKPIPAVLARTIMSGTSGNVPVTAIVERNVYAEDGRNIVIPAGSRVMGESSGGSGGGSGSVRVSITWKRLIRPDGSAFEFSDAQTGDAQGKGGALGYVDEQLAKKYTLPIVTNLLSSAVAYVMADGESTTSSDGGTTEDNRAEAANDARENFLNNMDQMFQEILADKTNIEAVTYVPAGTRLIIYPKVDLWIRTPERSEEEALQDVEKPTVFIDDRNPTGTGNSSNSGSGGSAGGGNATTGTSPGTSGVVYLDENAEDVQATMPLIDDTSNNKKKTPASTAIPPVTSTGATPPPPSTTSGASNNTSAKLF